MPSWEWQGRLPMWWGAEDAVCVAESEEDKVHIRDWLTEALPVSWKCSQYLCFVLFCFNTFNTKKQPYFFVRVLVTAIITFGSWLSRFGYAPDLHIQLPVWHLPKTRVSNWTQSFPKPISPVFLIAVTRTLIDPFTETRNLSSPRLSLLSPWSHSTGGFSFPFQCLSFPIKHMLREARDRDYCQCSLLLSPASA